MENDCSFIYVTVGDAEAAAAIGRAMVERRLAACANIIDGVRSIYWWQGNLEDDRQAVLILKTRRGLVPEVIAAVKAAHDDDCPDILEWPIASGNPDFLDWIRTETGG